MTTETETTEAPDAAPDQESYVLTVTPEALERVIEIRNGEEDPGAL